MNEKINFNNSSHLNISNSSEKELNDILTEDLLTYSEDKSQSIINNNQMMDNNRVIVNNMSIKGKNFEKEENKETSKKSEIDINIFKNKNIDENQIKNYIKEKGNKKINNEANSFNNKDLSALQISLSNLLSDVDSKDIFFNHNNKIKDNFNKKSTKINSLIDISYENESSNKDIITNNNINIKHKDGQKEELSSTFSICNNSQNLYNNSNNYNNKNINNINNNNVFIIGNNYINCSKTKENKSNNSLKYNEEQNINIYINSKNKSNKNEDKNLTIYKNNNENNEMFPDIKPQFQIEKGENIELSISDNFNHNKNKDSVIHNYNIKKNLIINKVHNFTISNSTIVNNNINSNNISEFYDHLKKNKTASIEIIKEETKNNKISGIINNLNYQKNNNKNKLKLINNKNIDIQKEESKKFFYYPKLNTNRIIYINKDNKNSKYNKKDYNLNINIHNKSDVSYFHMETCPNNKEKNLILNKLIKDYKKIYKHINQNKTNIYYNNIYYHRNNSKGENINVKKENPKHFSKKLFYIKKKRKMTSNYNSHNNSSNKKSHVMKIKNKTRNIKLSDLDKKNNYSITYYKKNNNESKSKSKSKSKQKSNIIKNECITEPSKEYNRKKYSCESQRNTNLIAKNFIKQIKSAQKKTTKKLINKLNNINNMNKININIINKGSLFPIFSKILEKKIDNKNSIEKIKKTKNKKITGVSLNKLCENKKNIKVGVKSNKLSNNIENINIKKEKKGNNNINKYKKNNNSKNPHKKIYTQINFFSLLNSFNNGKEKNSKINKSLYNFGNIFFINQSQTIKKGDNDLLSSKLHDKTIGLNKEKMIFINDNLDNSKLNNLNFSNIKQKPKIINDFSNYKKKENNIDKNIDNGVINSTSSIIKNSDMLFKKKKNETDIDFKIKNNFKLKNKIKDSFKLKKIEDDK